jgi:hypothetical protein
MPCDKSKKCIKDNSIVIYKKLKKYIKHSDFVCTKLDKCIQNDNNGTICTKIYECIKKDNNGTVCTKIDECLLSKANKYTENPSFVFNKIPFPSTIPDDIKDEINSSGGYIRDTLNSIKDKIYNAILKSNYEDLAKAIPDGMSMSIFDSIGGTLLADLGKRNLPTYKDGTLLADSLFSRLPVHILPVILQQWLIQLSYTYYIDAQNIHQFYTTTTAWREGSDGTPVGSFDKQKKNSTEAGILNIYMTIQLILDSLFWILYWV